jgi:hypothetical protein
MQPLDPFSIASIVGLAAQGLTSLVGLIPTKADIQRNKDVKELTAKEEAGSLGLSKKQKEELLALGMAPIQAQAREARARAGEQVGAQEVGAGASLVRQAAVEQGITKAARDVGLQIQKENIAEAQRQKQELERKRLEQQQLAGQRASLAAKTAANITTQAAQIASSAQLGNMLGILGTSGLAKATVAAPVEGRQNLYETKANGTEGLSLQGATVIGSLLGVDPSTLVGIDRAAIDKLFIERNK